MTAPVKPKKSVGLNVSEPVGPDSSLSRDPKWVDEYGQPANDVVAFIQKFGQPARKLPGGGILWEMRREGNIVFLDSGEQVQIPDAILHGPKPAAHREIVRIFLEIITNQAKRAIGEAERPGLLQLTRQHPLDEKKFAPSRFALDDLKGMIDTAVNDANAGHNVFVEPRTVRAGLTKGRGKEIDTSWVFALVVDSDADKGDAAHDLPKPSLVVETSAPHNRHLWYFFEEALTPVEAKALGLILKEACGGDKNTGVITQPYRVAGTPNRPTASKVSRGRTRACPTGIIEYSGRLWTPQQLRAALNVPNTAKPKRSARDDAHERRSEEAREEAQLPHDLMVCIKFGESNDRSVDFHRSVWSLRRLGWSIDAIVELMERYPDGICKKYESRLH
jgi:hypothetical protein